MKISEPLVATPQQTSTKLSSSQDNLDFELWLKTPTKQNSGDEYYWQHQEQLQQSALQFDSLTLAHQQQQNIKVSSIQLASQLTDLQIMDRPINRDSLNVLHEEINKPGSSAAEALNLLIQTEQKSSPTIMPCEVNSSSLSIRNSMERKEIKVINDSNARYTFKNHHLFIQDQEAELTLNNQGMDAKEEKELIQTIKTFLKDKGIALNKLIINGVKYD
ncbi:hypothetical protein [Legionella fallonii]|uniref:Uncharacterized protein n=1 Tax=Legionella fallonii LLAP-10 TaxID=1212491 RepID=A0A098G654_9GAMM|nr:hypothetical protein [Legionella fallonii]CEG57449.1 conserved protein of unknown function [Legionella fallonii LLAP-10]